MTQRADAHIVRLASLSRWSEMLVHSTTLRSMDQGRAIYSMVFRTIRNAEGEAEKSFSKVKG